MSSGACHGAAWTPSPGQGSCPGKPTPVRADPARSAHFTSFFLRRLFFLCPSAPPCGGKVGPASRRALPRVGRIRPGPPTSPPSSAGGSSSSSLLHRRAFPAPRATGPAGVSCVSTAVTRRRTRGNPGHTRREAVFTSGAPRTRRRNSGRTDKDRISRVRGRRPPHENSVPSLAALILSRGVR